MTRPSTSCTAIRDIVVRPSQEWRLNMFGMGGWARLWDSQTDQMPGTATATLRNIVRLWRHLLVLLQTGKLVSTFRRKYFYHLAIHGVTLYMMDPTPSRMMESDMRSGCQENCFPGSEFQVNPPS